MALYVLGDLHLSLGGSKPMDIFPGWADHVQRMAAAWDRMVQPADTVVIPGDLSWGMNLAAARDDFAYVQERPGKKIILKGNHDYYWTTMKKMTDFLAGNGFDSISILHNRSIEAEGMALCGTRGWMPEKDDAFNRKMIEREAIRLEASLKDAKGDLERVVFLHYPPMDRDTTPIAPLTELLSAFSVRRCYFGHLHGQARMTAPVGFIGGVTYALVSADALDFKPLLIRPAE